MTISVVKEVELKPCPFCGESAVLKTDHMGASYESAGLYYWAKCTNHDCGISTQAHREQVAAVKAWQTRRNPVAA